MRANTSRQARTFWRYRWRSSRVNVLAATCWPTPTVSAKTTPGYNSALTRTRVKPRYRRSMLGPIWVEDPGGSFQVVRLCADLPLENRDFARENGGWVLRLPALGLHRLEYQLEIVAADGTNEVVLDPGNDLRAPGAFGPKSVVVAGGHEPPRWLEGPAISGTRQEINVRVLGEDLPVTVWSPAEGPLPLLVAHDGPEYDALSGLTRWAGAMIALDHLPPFRVALLPPGERDEWYSASAHYSRALCWRILPALRGEFDTAGAPVGMGASLGGLAMLHAQRRWPRRFSALFLQSGSFFLPRFDAHEHRFPRYARIVRFVRGVMRAEGTHPDPVPVVMTCGSEEENFRNNQLMASVLAAQGYEVKLHQLADLHNYTGWRDAVDPHLTKLLVDLWPNR
jgi:enterochelin esterase-like enzyme